jgi:hypothetical protein
MTKQQVLLIAVLSSLLTVAIGVGSLLIFSQAVAAPEASSAAQTSGRAYVSVSALAFEPMFPQTPPAYTKSFPQFLSLNTTDRGPESQGNWFAAPLNLPHNSTLAGMTVFGQDNDPAGRMTVFLWNCDHSGTNGCQTIASYDTMLNSVNTAVDSGRLTINHRVNNEAYTYVLGLNLWAVNNSGLRSVRLELTNLSTELPGGAPPTQAEVSWTVPAYGQTQLLNLSQAAEVRICTDVLGRNSLPTLAVDDSNQYQLQSDTCVVYTGQRFKLIGDINPASGTYQILR